jgi:mannose-6-phosphate isomerase-like protein (cupin superfamily)
VAGASGLTAGFLSRLERDELQPSVASLVRLCEVLGVRVGSLFDPPETAVVRRGQGQPINFGGVDVAETLLTPGTQARLQVIHADVEPGGNGGEDLYSLDSDFDCVYVVTGSLVVTNESGDTELGAGDAMTFPARQPHTWRNPSTTQSSEVLWILTPAP